MIQRAAQFGEQVEHLRLDRHVERGHRYRRTPGIRAGPRGARAMPMRARCPPELMRVTSTTSIEADAIQQ